MCYSIRDVGDGFLCLSTGYGFGHSAAVSDGVACKLKLACSGCASIRVYQLEPAMMHMRPFPQLIMVDELRNDYRNPMDFCQNLNRVSRLQTALCDVNTIFVCIPFNIQLVLPEYGLHVAVTLMLLVCGYWFTFLLNVPLLVYHILRWAPLDTHSTQIYPSLPPSLSLPPLPSLPPPPPPPPSLSLSPADTCGVPVGCLVWDCTTPRKL